MFSIIDDDIRISRGDSSGKFSAALADTEGNPYELQEGDSLVLRVKKRTTDEDCLIELTADQDMQFELKPQNTANLDVGRYKYQLCLSNQDDVFRPIRVHDFFIEEVV